ncbi:MAG: hypothetical protein ABIH18_05700 [Candidatus Omnitrophota bacterium]
MPKKNLYCSLITGSIYFFLVSVAHMAGIKIPVFFIYFNVPSYAYQDRIISFLAFGWAMFLLCAAINVKNGLMNSIKYILLAGAAGIIGLSLINISTDFKQLSQDINPLFFWLETGGLLIYFIWLLVFYIKANNE